MALTDTLVDIGDAIRTKDGTASPIPFLDMPERILAIPSGGGGGEEVEWRDVNFIDYDGTLRHSYTVSQAAALASLPAGPTHPGLVFQEWNWALAGIKSLAAPICVGATYTTASGKSEFDIVLTSATGRSVTMLITNASSGNAISVDWGDGSSENAPTTSTGEKTFTHTYSANGNYTISVDSAGAYFPSGRASNPYNMFQVNPSYICAAVRLGSRCTQLGEYAFRGCLNIKNITVPNSVIYMGNHAVRGNYELACIVIPSEFTSISNYGLAECYNLSAPLLPSGITSIIGSAFLSNNSTNRIHIPAGVTAINDSTFSGHSSAAEYHFHRTTPPTLNNTNAFSNINGLSIIYVPPGSLAAYQSATNWAAYANYIKEWTV